MLMFCSQHLEQTHENQEEVSVVPPPPPTHSSRNLSTTPPDLDKVAQTSLQRPYVTTKRFYEAPPSLHIKVWDAAIKY